MKKLFPVLIVTLLLMATGNNVFSQVTTVPAGGSPYANLGAAFTAINAGGVYAGVAVTVTITANLVEPALASLNGGIFTSCTISPSGVRTVTGSFDEAVIVLNGADNVTIDGLNTGGNSLTITNTNVGTLSGAIRLSEGAQNNTIRNCACNGVGVANTAGGRVINVGQSTNGIGNNNTIIENNVVSGGRRGIQTFGTATATGVTNDNTIIRNNIVKNSSALHIFVGSETSGTTVTGNEIFNDAAVAGDVQTRAIAIQGVGLIEVRNNRIHDVSYISFTPPTPPATNGLIGIISIPVVLTAPGSNATTVNMINNMVAYTNNNDPAQFIYGVAPLSTTPPSDAAYTANVFNNSVHIGGVTGPAVLGYTAALEVAVSTIGSSVNVANNIAINTRTGGLDTTFHIGDDETSMPSPGVTFSSDYNFSRGTDTTGGQARGWDGGYNGFVYRGDGGLETMKQDACSEGNGQHNVYKRVNFVSPVNLHLAGGIGGDMCGKPLVAVPLDIDGTPRNATYPYRGADEGPALKIFTMGGCLEASAALDQVTVVLKTGGCVIVSSCTADITPGAGGTAVFCFGDSAGAGPFYLDVQNRNHLETYSAATVPFGGSPSYNFKTARTQAFGSNMTAAGPPFCFYGGDVNQDGSINGTDVIEVQNANVAFLTGCRLPEDITGEGTVNATDAITTFNNNVLFVTVAKPCPEPTSVSNPQNTRIEKVSVRNRDMINSMSF